MSRRSSQSLGRIFAIPLLLALLSIIGLVVALAGDGFPDALSWLTLATPVAAVAWAMRARRS